MNGFTRNGYSFMNWEIKLFAGLKPNSRSGIFKDAIAGLSLATMNIPQVLGYTRIAGVTAVSGLYTVFLPLFVFAIFGSSRYLVVAADSATAAIFASNLSLMASPESEQYMNLVGMVALLTAGFLLLARIFRLGFLADFLSRTVLVGFLTGIGVQISIAMLGDMFGIQTGSYTTMGQIQQIKDSIAYLNMSSVTISALVITTIYTCKLLNLKLPIALIAVVAGITASYMYDFSNHGIAVIGKVSGGLPDIKLPVVTWKESLQLMPTALSCFLIIIAQSAATSRVFAIRHEEKVDENSDILGLSAANAVAALSGAFVVNGSPTQTAMAEQAGSRSQVAQLVFAGVVFLVLLFLTKPLEYLPRAILAGIVFTIGISLIDIKSIQNIYKESRGEFILTIVTAVTVIVVGLEQGIVLAVTLSLLRHVRHSYAPHTAVLINDEENELISVAARPGTQTKPGLIIYRFSADLFYANDNRFSEEIRNLISNAPDRVRWVLIDASAMTSIDYSASISLKSLCQDLKKHGINMVFGRVNSYLKEDMIRHGITKQLGEENIFLTLHEALKKINNN
jgi:high affinity sulfate transporter 1